MTLTQMKYFIAVCRHKSFTGAAKEVHVSQPTITVSMRDLERETGLNLFRRIGRKIEITPEGQQLLAQVNVVMQKVDQLSETVQDLRHKREKIRIAVPLQIGTCLLPRLFREFRQAFPSISLDIVEAGGLDAIGMLEHEELDLAISNYEEDDRHLLRYIRISECECCFCTYPDHPLAKKSFIRSADIQNEPLVLLQGGFFVRRLVDRFFAEAEIKPEVILYSSQLHTVKNLVQQKTASTFLMRQAITEKDDIVPVPLERPLYINSGIILKRGHQLYSDERALIQFIKKNFPLHYNDTQQK